MASARREAGDDDEPTGRCEGLHAFLEREFWPPYVVPDVVAALSTPATNANAVRRGRIVDLQLAEWCKAVRNRRPMCLGVNKGSRRPRLVHAYTASLIHAFTDVWGWVPVRTQLPLLVRDWRLMTRADLVVRDRRTGRLILVEIKTTSGDGTAFVTPGAGGQRFHAPLDAVPSSPVNHALAQLTVTLAMLQRDQRRLWDAVHRPVDDAHIDADTGSGGVSGTYMDTDVVRVHDAFVVVADATKVRRIPLPPWCATLYAELRKKLDRFHPIEHHARKRKVA